MLKKNSDKTLKTDKQYFKEQKQMLKYVKGLGVNSYYKIAYTYFNDIQEMLNNGTSEEEIREFCFDRDDSFNFTLFYEKLVEYKEKHGSFAGVTMDKEIGNTVHTIRQAYKGKGGIRFTQEMIDKLNAIGFDWGKYKEDIEKQWFMPFYEKLIEYKESHNGSFFGVTQDEEIGGTVNAVRRAYKWKDGYKLTQEMIDKLNAIGFPWEVKIEDRFKDWFTPFYEKLINYKKRHNESFVGVTNDKEIGNTVSGVRQAYKYKDNEEIRKAKGLYNLTQEMIDKLNAIGFPWEARAKKVKDDVLSV